MNKDPINNQSADFEYGIVHIQQISKSQYSQSPHSYHYHNCYEIVIIEQGSVNMMIDYLPKEIGSDTVLMMGRNLPHGIIDLSEDIAGVLIHLSINSPLWNTDFISDSACDIQFIRESQYGYLFKSHDLAIKLVALSRKINKAMGFKKISYLFQLLNLLSTYSSRELLITNLDNNINRKKFPYETSLDRTFRYIYAHFQEELTLEKVASYSNLNASALCRSFKSACGCTIFQFINRLRIEKACRLLRDTDLNIAQVAYQVGFNSIAHFNNQFKRIVHTLPSSYRRS